MLEIIQTLVNKIKSNFLNIKFKPKTELTYEAIGGYKDYVISCHIKETPPINKKENQFIQIEAFIQKEEENIMFNYFSGYSNNMRRFVKHNVKNWINKVLEQIK